MEKYQLFATMGAGFESVVAKELTSLGYQTTTENGRVFFTGTQEDIARVNLWSRTADRFKILLQEFTATTFSELFDQINEFDWAKYIPLDGKFPVKAKSVKSKLHSEPDIQSIAKKAIAEKLTEQYHRRGFLPEVGSLYQLDVHILKDRVRVSLDTTGESLFKRGYRVEHGGAPLKENFAASLIALTPYNGTHSLIDPMTGSGTIAIEAAMKAKNIAPGLQRNFSFNEFDWFDQNIFIAQKELAENSQTEMESIIIASDIDQSILDIAKVNAHNAGVLQAIEFKQVAVKDFKTDTKNGIIIANPPYGKRLNDQESARKLYRQMGEVFIPMSDFSQYYLTSDQEFEKYFGKRATKKRKLFNGNLRTDFYQYWANETKK